MVLTSLVLRWAFSAIKESVFLYPRDVGLWTVVLEGLNCTIEQGLRITAVTVYHLLSRVRDQPFYERYGLAEAGIADFLWVYSIDTVDIEQ